MNPEMEQKHPEVYEIPQFKFVFDSTSRWGLAFIILGAALFVGWVA